MKIQKVKVKYIDEKNIWKGQHFLGPLTSFHRKLGYNTLSFGAAFGAIPYTVRQFLIVIGAKRDVCILSGARISLTIRNALHWENVQ